jgi:hypothetical protein
VVAFKTTPSNSTTTTFEFTNPRASPILAHTNHATNTINTMIQIITDDKLASYTHAASEQTARDLARQIAWLNENGFRVIEATSERRTVSRSYKFAFKLIAPAYHYDGQSIELRSMRLETRPHGSPIPARITVAGHDVPAGYRCVRRLSDSVEVRPI